ncbi:MAG: secondary thiamine-phosphate synthase enzyme YjbQ [Elusimicrobiota bacterium]
MKILNSTIKLSTKGNCDIHNITATVREKLHNSKLKSGMITVFVPGATGAITAGEFESGLLSDMKNSFEKLVPEGEKYNHDRNHPGGNAPSHLKASIVGPSLVIPFEEGELQLGTWQQILFIDFDNRPRQREIIVKIIGD